MYIYYVCIYNPPLYFVAALITIYFQFTCSWFSLIFLEHPSVVLLLISAWRSLALHSFGSPAQFLFQNFFHIHAYIPYYICNIQYMHYKAYNHICMVHCICNGPFDGILVCKFYYLHRISKYHTLYIFILICIYSFVISWRLANLSGSNMFIWWIWNVCNLLSKFVCSQSKKLVNYVSRKLIKLFK